MRQGGYCRAQSLLFGFCRANERQAHAAAVPAADCQRGLHGHGIDRDEQRLEERIQIRVRNRRAADAANEKVADHGLHLRDGEVGWDELMWMPTGASPVTYLQQWGVLSSNLLAAHCVQVSPEDIEVLKEHDVAIAHCPKSNAKLACGIAPVGDFLEAGLRVGIGTDSLASNNLLDMFGEMRVGLLLHRASRQSTEGLQAEQVLRMATLGGAEVLGLADQYGAPDVAKTMYGYAFPGEIAKRSLDKDAIAGVQWIY